jgi:hypothetical protein
MSKIAAPARRSPARGPQSVESVSLPARIGAAALAAAVSYIHVKDQGGIGVLKDPAYLGQGYRVLEIAGLVAAVLLVLRPGVTAWILAAGVAAGPLVGIIVSRSVGLPSARDDIGNWGEPLGLWAMAVEALLLIVALTALARGGRRART